MKIGQNAAKLYRPIHHVFLLLPPIFPEQTLQRSPFYVIHNNQKASPSLNHICNPRKMRIPELLHQLNLFPVCLKTTKIIFYNLLYCPWLIRAFIDSQIDDAHSAFPDHIQDLVFSSHDRADLKHYVLLLRTQRNRLFSYFLFLHFSFYIFSFSFFNFSLFFSFGNTGDTPRMLLRRSAGEPVRLF